MPLLGTLDVVPRLADAPKLDNYDTEAWEIAGVELLSLTFEIDDRQMTAALPPALYPTIPPVAYFSVAAYPESPIGPFALAQVRVGCRASALPRGFLLRAYSDSPAACDALGRRWGISACPPTSVSGVTTTASSALWPSMAGRCSGLLCSTHSRSPAAASFTSRR